MLNWSDFENQEIKSLIRNLEGKACDCDMMIGHHCESHKTANKLRDLILEEIEKK